ncbi:hypothetical protein [Paracoccus alcaliphilus]|uniref:hypothetical protein n=1 Tax=Paracoccus alcaliphilus TaxID=34002 RepID=UPI0023503440|nr:hypothetical protein [Paracoccus alcaliphilus]WCR18745.1 hypothetical protein JHW40_03215 [Paracoccus alcaliphilus]
MSDADENTGKRPLAEWIFGLLSGCGIAALILFLSWQALFSSSHAPDLVVSVIGVERKGDANIATVEVANHGDRAASAVTVLAEGQRVVEFDYVAAHSIRRGAVGLPGGWSAGDPSIGIGGFAEP